MRDCPDRRGNYDFMHIVVGLDKDRYESVGALVVLSFEV